MTLSTCIKGKSRAVRSFSSETDACTAIGRIPSTATSIRVSTRHTPRLSFIMSASILASRRRSSMRRRILSFPSPAIRNNLACSSVSGPGICYRVCLRRHGFILREIKTSNPSIFSRNLQLSGNMASSNQSTTIEAGAIQEGSSICGGFLFHGLNQQNTAVGKHPRLVQCMRQHLRGVVNLQ